MKPRLRASDSYTTSIYLLLTLLTFSLQDDDHPHHPKTPSHLHIHPTAQYIAGRTTDYLPDPIFYDSYIPLIYSIPIPRYTSSALRLLWAGVQSCNSSSIQSGYLCPISHHLFQLTQRFADDLGFWKPFYVNHTSTSSRKESFKKRTGFEILCNEISQHFFRSYTNRSQLDSYVTSLRACSRIGFRGNFSPGESWVVDKAIYYKMLESFKTSYFNDLPQEGKVDWAVFLNSYTSVHGLLLTNHLMESVRLATAHRVCQSGLIPETFIPMSMLKSGLSDLVQNLTSKNYQLVYSNLDQDLEEYYKLPLADCTFSDDYTFIIRILAPIRRSELSHRLVEINTIPFLEQLPESSGIPTRLCRLKLSSPKFTLIETSTGLLLDTHCQSNQLCKTSEVATIFENDACTSSLLTNDRRLITNNCKFSCFPVAAPALPLIQRVSPDTYVVVGGSDVKINLNCFTQPEKLREIPLKNLGALRIKLACDCQLLYSNHVSYRPRDPCGKKTSVEHILPYHWYREDKEDHHHQLNGTEPPSTGSQSQTDSDEAPSTDPSSDGDTGGTSHPDSSTTTADLDDAQIEKSLEKQEAELADQFKGSDKPKHHDVVFKKLSEIPNGLIIQLIMLWILVIILLFLILVLGYHVHQLLRWKELQAYKETRVLYRPNENNKINRSGSGGIRVAWDSFYDLFTTH